ncbi:helix-turn-helix domain-containing protein [Aminipila sp.]|uniref:helix-turn-helix domain-containing protein n=1 Tax=Aminipila sp. TaxID=2060095 RepID=UPI00289774EB|nr:helix-turn-helix domain-containing protein [Aminipila sp.]
MAKKEKKHQLVDILRVEGIMAQGYGLNPKIVMRDKRLTPEAKCIYSYLASFAGGGNQAFPSRNIMLEELQMSKDRYYKHLKYLTDADYIRVERTKNSTGTFDKNIYTIVALPNPVVADENVPEDMKKNENTENQNSKPAGRQKKSGIKKLHVKERASVMELRQRLDIDNLKLCDPDHAELIEDIFMAVEDMNISEQISIGGNVKKREAIEGLLNQLTADHIRLVVQIMVKNKKTLINRKSYLQTCIANSIFDIRNKNKNEELIMKTKEQKEADEKEQVEKMEAEKQELIKAYKQYPELKQLDENITEVMKKVSKAVLSGNELLLQSLKNENEKLLTKRTELLKRNGLKLSI